MDSRGNPKVVPKLPGQTAIELLREYKRTEGNVSHFPDDKRREIVQEICTLMDEYRSLSQDNPTLAGMKLVGAMRSKQIFLTFLYVLQHLLYLKLRGARLHLLEQIRWEVGMIPNEIKEKLSKDELHYFEHYNSLVAGYIDDLQLDLTQV